MSNSMVQERSQDAEASDSDGSIMRSVAVASFYFARLHGFAEWCEAMEPERALIFVAEVRTMLTLPVMRLHGEVAHRRPDSMLAVFSNRPEDAKPNHAQRALHAAIVGVHETVTLGSTWLLARWNGPRPRLPALRLSVGVHLGPGEVARRRGKWDGRILATGEGVDIARELEAIATARHWSIAATAGTHFAACGRAQRARSAYAQISSGAPSEVVEISGLIPRKDSTTPAAFYESLRVSLAENGRK